MSKTSGTTKAKFGCGETLYTLTGICVSLVVVVGLAYVLWVMQ